MSFRTPLAWQDDAEHRLGTRLHRYLAMTTDDDASKIAGNVSDDIKKKIRSLENALPRRIFGGSVFSRMKVTEVSILAKAEEPERLEGRVVCELDVAEGEQFRC